MATIIEKEGVFKNIDVVNDTETWMYPDVKTDSTLSVEGKPADAKTVGEAVKRIHSYSEGTISSAGWYRVAQYRGYTIGGEVANSCDFTVKTGNAGNTKSEYLLLRLRTANNSSKDKFDIICLDHKNYNTSSLFSKARYVANYRNGIAYFELYYTKYDANRIGIETRNGADYFSEWETITPTATEETVDGFTVPTTYDIPGNVSPATSVDLENIASFNFNKGSYHSSAPTGAFKITIPEEHMIHLNIAFRSYNTSFECFVSGYTYTKNNWHLPAINILGLKTPHPVALYTNSDKTEHYIVIGSVTDVQLYPQIDICNVGIGWGTKDLVDLRDKIKIELVTDISDLTLNYSNTQRVMNNTNFALSNGVLTINLD